MTWSDLHRAKQLVDGLLQLDAPGRADAELRRLREAVAECKEASSTPAQMAAVFHLEDVLHWEETSVRLWPVAKNEIGVRLTEVKQYLGDWPALSEKLNRLHHAWINSAALEGQDNSGPSQFCPEAQPILTSGLAWPEAETLNSCLQYAREAPGEDWQRFHDYVARNRAELAKLQTSLAAELARVVDLATPRRAVSRIQHVLVVEDHPGWQAKVTRVVSETIADLGPIAVTAVGNCVAAREFAKENERHGILAICDLALPEQTGVPHERNGLTLIDDLSKYPRCKIIALTSHSHLDLHFAGLERHLQDFFLKERDDWATELGDRLRALLTPLSPKRLPVIVPAFDAKRILVDGIPVELSPLAFAFVDALAFGYPATQDEFLRMTTHYWSDAARMAPLRRQAMSAQELKTVACWREVTDLKADFADFKEVTLDKHQQQVRDYISEISACLRNNFRHFGIDVAAEEFIQIEGTGTDQSYRLAGPAVVCDTPEQFFRQRRPFRILVVEDNPTWRGRLRATLEGLAVGEVFEAATYEEALKQACAWRPNLISLDLEIPRNGASRPENGVNLRKELTRTLGSGDVGSPSFLVLTAHDLPWLRQEIARLAPGPDFPTAANKFQTLDLLRRRVDARAIFLKQDGDAALQQVFREAWRVLQEHRTGGGWRHDGPKTLHTIDVRVDETWDLRIDGRKMSNKARGQNRARDHDLLTVLALYANVFLRGQAILDHWAEKQMLAKNDVKNPRQLLTERVQFLREQMAEQLSIEPAEAKDILAENDGGYALRGHVRLTT